MEKYLQQVSHILAALQRFTAVRIVMGNEACDLDSAICALVYAYVLHNEMSADRREVMAVVPLLNILKRELPLRTEVTYYLQRNSIPLDHLVFKDCVDLKQLQMSGKLELTLVDHHVLSPQDEFLRTSVVEIIDHHPQDPAWLWPQQKVILTTAGSCCTLVANEVMQRCPKLISSQVATLLYGPIVLDTACFSQTADRTTDLDVRMAAEMEARGVASEGREKVFEELLAARCDVSCLTPSQLLVKDMKIASGVPVPGLPVLVEEFVTFLYAAEALKDFCTEQQTTVMVIMGLRIDGDQIRRDIAVFHTSGREVAHEVIERLKCSTNPALQLQMVELAPPHKIPGLELFRQLNITASRKQVLPIVRCAAESLVKQCQH